MELAVSKVKIRTTQRQSYTWTCGEGLTDLVVPVRMGSDGTFARAGAAAADLGPVFGLTLHEVDAGDQVDVTFDAILELTLANLLPQGATVVLSPNLGKLCLIQDLRPGDFLNYVGYAVEDNVLQVSLTPTGIAVTNPTPVYRPAAYAANQNDVDWGSYEIVEVSASGADRNVTGVLARPDGAQKLVVNVGASNNVVLKNEDAGSAAANRLHGPGAAPGDVVIGPGQSAALYYSAGTFNRWRMF